MDQMSLACLQARCLRRYEHPPAESASANDLQQADQRRRVEVRSHLDLHTAPPEPQSPSRRRPLVPPEPAQPAEGCPLPSVGTNVQASNPSCTGTDHPRRSLSPKHLGSAPIGSPPPGKPARPEHHVSFVLPFGLRTISSKPNFFHRVSLMPHSAPEPATVRMTVMAARPSVRTARSDRP